jgi:hypothetical protein
LAQKNLNRKRTIATKAKNAAISPPTTQKPFGLPLNGMSATFMPQRLAISVAGRNIIEHIVSIGIAKIEMHPDEIRVARC